MKYGMTNLILLKLQFWQIGLQFSDQQAVLFLNQYKAALIEIDKQMGRPRPLAVGQPICEEISLYISPRPLKMSPFHLNSQ